jgi:hypothetical protein
MSVTRQPGSSTPTPAPLALQSAVQKCFFKETNGEQSPGMKKYITDFVTQVRWKRGIKQSNPSQNT